MCKSGYGCYHNTVWPYHFQTACYGPERRWKVAGRLGGGGGQGGKVQGWCVGEGMKSD